VLEIQSGRVTYLGPGLFPAWSPDGRYLAVQRPRERGLGQFGLWVIDTEGREGDRPIFFDERFAASNPCWSPDGKALVFNTVGRGGDSLEGEGGGIYICRLNEGSGRLEGPLPGADHNAWRPVWGKDGRIYFHKREGEAVNLFAVKMQEASGSPPLAERAR